MRRKLDTRFRFSLYIMDDSHPVPVEYIDFDHRDELNDFKSLLKKDIRLVVHDT